MLFEENLENRVRLDTQGRVRIVQDLSIMANLQGPAEVALVVPEPEDRNMGIILKLVPIGEMSEDDVSYGKRKLDEKNRICFSQLLKVKDLDNYVWVVHGGRVCMKSINETTFSQNATTINSSIELLNLVAEDVAWARNELTSRLYSDFLMSVKKVIDLLANKLMPDDLASVSEIQIPYRIEVTGEDEDDKIYRSQKALCYFGNQVIVYEDDDVYLGTTGVLELALKALYERCKNDPFITVDDFDIENLYTTQSRDKDFSLVFKLNDGMQVWKSN